MNFLQAGPPIVLAIGFSVRSLVQACAACGLEALAVDHFGDSDTREYAVHGWLELKLTEECHLAAATLSALQVVASKFTSAGRSCVILLGGGMENLGAAVVQLRGIAKVLGPHEVQRHALRQIDFLRAAAEAVGILVPRVLHETVEGSVTDNMYENWLWKPRGSAGGHRVMRSTPLARPGQAGYLQAWIAGNQVGVTCSVTCDTCEILGATGGFDATDWPGPSEFIYRGSYGPTDLSLEDRVKIISLCSRIRAQIEYQGWLQFDFVRDHQQRLWLLECNPRWTAGMEILLQAQVNPVKHLCETFEYPLPSCGPKLNSTAFFAKAVVYARQHNLLTADKIALLNRLEGLADRPHAPQVIERGQPLATVWTKFDNQPGPSDIFDQRAHALNLLQRQAEQVQRIVESTFGGKI